MTSLSLLCGVALLPLLLHAASTRPRPLAGTARCVNVWDEGCVNGQLEGAGHDDDFVNGGLNPGKRCVNVWDEGCVGGQLEGAGRDDDFVNGGLNPGKRAQPHAQPAHAHDSTLREQYLASRLLAQLLDAALTDSDHSP